MGRVVVLGALGMVMLFASPSFAQTDFGVEGHAATRARPAPPERSTEEIDFDAGVAREMKLLEFTRRLAAEQADREAQRFAEEVTRYLKLSDFMRRLDQSHEAEETARFTARLALSSRVQRFMQVLSDKRQLAPEPIEWIRGMRAPSH